MLGQVLRQLSEKLELLPSSSRSNESAARYSPLGSPQLNHRRHISISSFNPRKFTCIACSAFFLFLIYIATSNTWVQALIDWHNVQSVNDRSPIPLGKSVDRGGREVFWWEQFEPLENYFRGRRDIVPPSEYVPEQAQIAGKFIPQSSASPELIPAASIEHNLLKCSIEPPKVYGYHGLPQGMPLPLFGSLEEIGMNTNICYDRINRYGPYGLTNSNVKLHGDNAPDQEARFRRFRGLKWGEAQEACIRQNNGALSKRPRTAFILRTWHDFEYTPYVVLMLRAMVNELSLRSGGQISLHFLIHVQDDSIPIWASEEVYQQVLKSSLPPEFEGMGTLWSVAQMKLIYPPPFPETIVNFSGGDVYEAYRSLHFPLQYFASQHPEFDYFWQWEMDIRVTGHYGELLDRITSWADKQDGDHLWERSSKFFIPSLYNNSFRAFSEAVKSETRASGQSPISGPQLPSDQLLPIPVQPGPTANLEITDFISLSPLFDPSRTAWAFHDDITGYPPRHRPPTRASLIAATRISRRLLLLMHQETFRNKHTMFPEMFPASVALHYGLKAVYAPITTYFDRDWPAEHADEIFNNAKLRAESFTSGMDHGQGHFHGPGGSVFGPGEHVFRGASWYSNAGFAGYLWRRWLGTENNLDEIDWELGAGNGRMCLPMMIMHPVKFET